MATASSERAVAVLCATGVGLALLLRSGPPAPAEHQAAESTPAESRPIEATPASTRAGQPVPAGAHADPRGGEAREPAPALTGPTVAAATARRQEAWEEAENRRNEQSAKAHSGGHL